MPACAGMTAETPLLLSYIAKTPCYRRKKKILPVIAGGIYTLDGSIIYSGDISPCSNIFATYRKADILIPEGLELFGPNPLMRKG